jgi:hypothetical protein
LIRSIREIVTDDFLARHQNDLRFVRGCIVETLRDIITLTSSSTGLNENVLAEYLSICNEIKFYNRILTTSLAYLLMKTSMHIDNKTEIMERNSQQSTHFNPSLHEAFDQSRNQLRDQSPNQSCDQPRNQSRKVSNAVAPEIVIHKQIKVDCINLRKPHLRSLDCVSPASGSTNECSQSQDYGFFDEDSCKSSRKSSNDERYMGI